MLSVSCLMMGLCSGYRPGVCELSYFGRLTLRTPQSDWAQLQKEYRPLNFELVELVMMQGATQTSTVGRYLQGFPDDRVSSFRAAIGLSHTGALCGATIVVAPKSGESRLDKEALFCV